MYFERVVIQNFKAIQTMELTFTPGVNLLIGDNGVGKTSVLEALTVALGGYLNGITGVTAKGIQQTDIRIEQTPIADASMGLRYITPVDIESQVRIGEQEYLWHRCRQDESGNSRTKTIGKEFVNYTKTISNDSQAQLPLLSYLSTGRVFASKREDSGSAQKKKLNDRRRGYVGCLDNALDIKAIKHWCLEMELTSFQLGKPIHEYELFKETVSSVMQKMNGLEQAPQIFYSRVFDDVVYAENGTSLPITYLSAGYQSLLWIIMNLAYRATLLNPEYKSLAETRGIVLIDELDMHLHPRWQWNALAVLQSVFPELQFIIATHSPILISSCKNGSLIKIEDAQNVEYLPSAYAYSIGDVLEFRQTSTAIPAEIKALSRQFEMALDDGNYEEAQAIYQTMLEQYGPENSEVKSAQFELELGADEE